MRTFIFTILLVFSLGKVYGDQFISIELGAGHTDINKSYSVSDANREISSKLIGLSAGLDLARNIDIGLSASLNFKNLLGTSDKYRVSNLEAQSRYNILLNKL